MPTKRSSSKKPKNRPFVDCYLTLARLVQVMTTPTSAQRNLVMRDAIEFVLTHCAFCGEAASSFSRSHGPAVHVILCDRCYRSPLNPVTARKVLAEPAFRHFRQREEGVRGGERKSA